MPEPNGPNFQAADNPVASREGDYFCGSRRTCEILYDWLCSDSRRTGLLAVTGATASGKSTVARGLIYSLMQKAVERSRKQRTRRPHLITFEDPVEMFYSDGADQPEMATPRDFDYTPRERGFDAPDLRSVFRDALRQTPTLVFVGEIRDRHEWKDVIEFVGTGHTVVATAHAGSLAESWGKILTAVDARTPAERSDVADRVLGIVHLRPLPETGLKGALPAVWKYTSSGAKSLMAEGRSSLVPLLTPSEGGYSSMGRVAFLKEIFKKTPNLSEDLAKMWPNLLDVVYRSDLEGI